MLAVLLIAGSAHAVSIKGRDISTISDILRHARGLTGKNVTLELRKASLLRLHDDGQFDLRYNIGNGDKDSSLGKIKDFTTGFANRSDGFIAAVTKRNFGEKKILVSSQKSMFNIKRVLGGITVQQWFELHTNWFYDIYFATLKQGLISGHCSLTLLAMSSTRSSMTLSRQKKALILFR